MNGKNFFSCCPQPTSERAGYVKYISGDTRLEHVSAEAMKTMFRNELAGIYNATQLLQVHPFQEYFTDENVAFICGTIARTLTLLFKGESFVVPANNELALAIVDVATRNLGLASAVPAPGALRFMNTEVIKREAEIQYVSMSQKLRYHKQILENDRMKTMPYGEYTRSVRGEVTISTSDYNLSDPRKRFRDSYLQVSEGLEWCPGKGYVPIPNYLLPTTKKTTVE